MTPPGDVQLLISSLNKFDSDENGVLKDAEIVTNYLDVILTSNDGIASLKQPNKHFENALALFFKIVFSENRSCSEKCLKNSNVIVDIFRSKLPKIKKQEWWKQFELEFLVKCIPKLSDRISPSDGSWVELWSFIANLIITDSALSTVPLNTLLSISEIAFKKGKENSDILTQAWKCWIALIDTFGRSPNVLLPAKTMNLLMKPLQACHTVSVWRIHAWIHLVRVKGLAATEDKLKQLVESLCKAMYKSPGDKAICRHLPKDCARAIVDLINIQRVSQLCLEEIISVFEPCVNSRPSELLEKVVVAVFEAVNGVTDENRSYELFCSLLEQFINCEEHLISNNVCNVIFDLEIFQRWIISDSTHVEDINKLMPSTDFRSRVLLPAITSLRPIDDESSLQKKRPKKPHDSIWSKYCEAYTTWWASQSSCSALPEAKNLICDEESNDFKALLALMLHPIYSYTWNQSIFKSWTLICEVSRALNALRPSLHSLFDALLEQNVQKTIDILSHLSYLDNTFCKTAGPLFDKLCSKVNLMDVKHIMDLLTILESAVNYKELTPSVNKLLKNISDKCSELDQLNAHKVKTKCGKVSRKLESLSYVSDVKTQRTPFRTQSNFLQRLAKAEEKNRMKNSYMTSIYSDEKNKDSLPEGGECNIEHVSSSDSNEDRPKTTILPIVNDLALDNSATSPMKVIDSSAQLNGVQMETESAIVAEKENVIHPAVATTNFSPITKNKITNAREIVKIVDSSSPSQIKKVKQFAGQKITPKKVTPSKVSYFDDDASDCVMVPPKPKTTPLTEHQMEMMVKRRADIPALYQDLSQDTQLSNPSSIVIQEIKETTTKSNELEDIFNEITPCKNETYSTSQLEKNSSAKKLDFTVSSSMDNEQSDSSSAPLASKLDLSSNDNVDPISENKTATIEDAIVNDEQSMIIDDSFEDNVKTELVLKGENQRTSNNEDECISEGRNRRKRKSDPIKFSPKLTRSKKNVTPKVDLSKSLPLDITDDGPNTKRLVEASEMCSPIVTNGVISEEKLDSKIAVLTKENSSTILSRKRRNGDSPGNEIPKKLKMSEEVEGSSKKLAVPRKKKKFLKLGCNNLENWLVKTERITEVVENPSDFAKEPPKTSEVLSDEHQQVPIENAEIDDLNNSEDIVPGTQEFDPIHLPSTLLSGSLTTCSSFVEEERHVNDNENKENVGNQYENKLELEKQVTTTIIDSLPDRENELNSSDSSPNFAQNEQSSPEAILLESPDNENVDLIISSPSKRQRRATSVMRGEGDTYLENDSSQESNEGRSRMLRKRTLSSPSKKTRKQSLPTGRSARMLHLAASSVSTEDDNCSTTTPVRKRGNIVPQKFGENWPKGPTTDWVACTPISPYLSPVRSVLKKMSTPGSEELRTPVRSHHDIMTSPLLSSSKRKRVVFLDPPVTKGLLYERDSPFGALHLAAVPEGSPHPTWTPEEERLGKADESPDSDEFLNESCLDINERLDDIRDKEYEKPVVLHDELLFKEPTIEMKLADLKERDNLDDSFLETLASTSSQIQHLLLDCFNSGDLNKTVRSWTLENCLTVCKLPENFLRLIKNYNGETVNEVVKEIVLLFLPGSAITFNTSSVQTISPQLTDMGAQVSVPTCTTESQTCTLVVHAETNTISPPSIDECTQADLPLPTEDELTRLLSQLGSRGALKYLSTALGLLATTNYD